MKIDTNTNTNTNLNANIVGPSSFLLDLTIEENKKNNFCFLHDNMIHRKAGNRNVKKKYSKDNIGGPSSSLHCSTIEDNKNNSKVDRQKLNTLNTRIT